MTKHHKSFTLGALALATALGCGASAETPETPDMQLQPAARITAPTGNVKLYVAELLPLNDQLTDPSPVGRASFILREVSDRLQATVNVSNVAPGMHMQHVHGFANKDAICPTTDADRNNDGVIDSSEAHHYTGQSLIPLNAAPADLDPMSRSYPSARNGALEYSKVLSASRLRLGLAARGYGSLKLEDRVVLLHGAGPGAKLPPSVASMSGATPAESVPIACGVIVRIR
jgi:hypothetical protein